MGLLQKLRGGNDYGPDSLEGLSGEERREGLLAELPQDDRHALDGVFVPKELIDSTIAPLSEPERLSLILDRIKADLSAPEGRQGIVTAKRLPEGVLQTNIVYVPRLPATALLD